MAKDTQKAVPLTEEQLIEKESGLKVLAQEITVAQENFVLEKDKFEEEKAIFETAKADFEKDKSIFETAKADLEAREKALDKKTEVKSDVKSEPISFDFEDEKYQFTAEAPQLINFGGQKFTQKQIIENEAILLQFIGGNSSLIIKK